LNNQNLNDESVCSRCIYIDKKKKFDEPFFYRDEPPIDLTDPELLGKPAVSTEDWQLFENFRNILDSDEMTECIRCFERWFNQHLNDESVCCRCIYVDKKKKSDEPFFYSDENHPDPGMVPSSLEPLTQFEEMLIARVHPFVEIRPIRGHQYKYSGHIVNFMSALPRCTMDFLSCLKILTS
jgi:hypothetical protein